MTIRPIDIRRYDVSAKRRFDKMTFRENDVAPWKLCAITIYRRWAHVDGKTLYQIRENADNITTDLTDFSA